MKIDFQLPDSTSQVKNLQDLLQLPNPNKGDVAMAMLIASMIFYENRPGKLHGLPGYFIHGTGCHNPTSEKSGKTIMGIWRTEITVERDNGSVLIIKRELMQNYLKAVFTHNKRKRIIAADISYDVDKETADAKAISIIGLSKDRESLMKDLYEFLKEPLNALPPTVQGQNDPVTNHSGYVREI